MSGEAAGLTDMQISALLVGIFALVQVPLTVLVGYRRAQTGIQFFRLGSASSMAFVVLMLVLTMIVIAFRRMEKAKTS